MRRVSRGDLDVLLAHTPQGIFATDDAAKAIPLAQEAIKLDKVRLEPYLTIAEAAAKAKQFELDQKYKQDERYVQNLAGNFQNYAAGQAMIGAGQGMAAHGVEDEASLEVGSVRPAVADRLQPVLLTLRSGCKKDGTLTALQARVIFDTGAYASWGPTVANRVAELGAQLSSDLADQDPVVLDQVQVGMRGDAELRVLGEVEADLPGDWLRFALRRAPTGRVRPRIDFDEEVALLDGLPFAKMKLDQFTVDPAAAPRLGQVIEKLDRIEARLKEAEKALPKKP